MSARHRAPGPARTPLTDSAKRMHAVGAVGLLALLPLAGGFGDFAQGKVNVAAGRWGTTVCSITGIVAPGSRPDIGGVLPATVVTRSPSLGALGGCDVLLADGENIGTDPSRIAVAQAWYDAGGVVLSTGNDQGTADYPLPQLIGSVWGPHPFQYRGMAPASAADRAQLSPAFPSWTPGSPDSEDAYAFGISSTAAGATCVATTSFPAGFCAAVARTNGAGGRWVHLQTRIGPTNEPGDLPLVRAAMTWLTSGRPA